MSLEEGLLFEMENYFAESSISGRGDDRRRIEHAKKVLRYAKKINTRENGDSAVVIASAILHDIGIPEAERKYNSSAGKYQEIEGPPVAKAILEKLNVDKSTINEVCKIIAHHHHPGVVNTKNFRILSDADWMVNLKDETKQNNRKKLKRIIDRVFLTESGWSLAVKIYLEKGG